MILSVLILISAPINYIRGECTYLTLFPVLLLKTDAINNSMKCIVLKNRGLVCCLKLEGYIRER